MTERFLSTVDLHRPRVTLTSSEATDPEIESEQSERGENQEGRPRVLDLVRAVEDLKADVKAALWMDGAAMPLLN